MLLAAIILGGGWWWSQQDQLEPADKKAEVPSALTLNNDIVQQEREVSSAPAQQEIAPPAANNSTPLGPPSQSSNEIPYLSEMSADFQTKMMELKFSGHVYSPEPSLRLIMINERVVREGDPISTELVLDEIYEDGVVIRHDRGRFRIKLF